MGFLLSGGCADLERLLNVGFGVVGTGGFGALGASSGVGERWDASESVDRRGTSTILAKDALDANSGERGVYVGDVRSMKDSVSEWSMFGLPDVLCGWCAGYKGELNKRGE